MLYCACRWDFPVGGLFEMVEKIMAYEHVNNAWPSGTNAGRDLKPTEQEAVRAVKLLWRKFMGEPLRIPVKLTTGRRRTWIRNRVMYVNCDERRWDGGGGWHEIVHSLSHLVAYRLHRGAKNHGTQHHWIEREMVKHVVSSGWLDGKLKRTVTEKPKLDVKAVRAQRVAAKLARWEAKKKRAETALRKLRRQATYYSRVSV